MISAGRARSWLRENRTLENQNAGLLVTQTEKNFNLDAFYQAVAAVVASREVPWRQVGRETGIAPSTLTRMSQGHGLDGAGLAKLCEWAGLNPADFVDGAEAGKPGTLASIIQLLREDPNLDPRSAKAIEAVVRTAYQALRQPAMQRSAPRRRASLQRREVTDFAWEAQAPSAD